MKAIVGVKAFMGLKGESFYVREGTRIVVTVSRHEEDEKEDPRDKGVPAKRILEKRAIFLIPLPVLEVGCASSRMDGHE